MSILAPVMLKMLASIDISNHVLSSIQTQLFPPLEGEAAAVIFKANYHDDLLGCLLE